MQHDPLWTGVFAESGARALSQAYRLALRSITSRPEVFGGVAPELIQSYLATQIIAKARSGKRDALELSAAAVESAEMLVRNRPRIGAALRQPGSIPQSVGSLAIELGGRDPAAALAATSSCPSDAGLADRSLSVDPLT